MPCLGSVPVTSGVMTAGDAEQAVWAWIAGHPKAIAQLWSVGGDAVCGDVVEWLGEADDSEV